MVMQNLLNEKKVAEITGRSIQTLRNDRHLGRGIPYVKLNRSVRYTPDMVEKYVEERVIKTQD